MTPKKNPKADLERKRPLFFLIGISLTLVGLIAVFQWETEHSIPDVIDEPLFEMVEVTMPITVRKMPNKVEKIEYKASNDKINPVDKIIKDVFLKIDMPVDIGDGDSLIDIEVIPIYETPEVIAAIIDKVAVPFECADEKDRSAQMDCLNNWLQKFISKNVNYPKWDRKIGNEGIVYVSFVIAGNGDLENVSIVRGEHEGLNREAERVLKKLPVFRPAAHKGKKAKMSMVVPVNFKLTN